MRSLVLDTNLLVLLVVGTFDRRLIAKHKRTRKFTQEDFDKLLGVIAGYSQIIVTPNVLTETSNLLQQTDNTTSRRLLNALRQMLSRLNERFVASIDAAAAPHFLFLGIADSAVLHAPPAGSVLLTDDLALYLQAARSGHTAFNFTYLQAQNLLS
jgi:hypothetical protein